MAESSILLLIAIFTPFIASIFIYYAGEKSEKLRNILSVSTCIISFLAILAMAPAVLSGKVLEFVLISGDYSIIEIVFRVDKLSLIIALFCSFEWIMATIYSIQYMDHGKSINRFFMFMSLTLGSVLGVLLTGNLISLFIFFELMLISSYVLVIHGETPKAMHAGKLYIYIGFITGLLMFLAIAMTYISAGTMDFGYGGILEFDGVKSYIIFGLFLIAAIAKAGIFPFHIWLPVAHPIAPSPASAVLSGILVKEGCYLMIRVFYDIFGIDLIATMGVHVFVSILAGFTMFFGAAMAIKQTDIKTMLGYSTISQMGYIFLGMSLLTLYGLQASIVHIINHAIMKSVLFFCIGAIIHQTGLRSVEDMKGIGKKMPITMGIFSIAALSMIGIPLLCGFITKWLLVLGILEVYSAKYFIFIILLILSSIMSAIYFSPIMINAFFKDWDENKNINAKDPSAYMLVPMLILAFLCILLGIYPDVIFLVIEPTSKALFGM
ncbi:MAG: monovalent cation/H+ antiporter subunit D family protein [Methanosarcinales archaeon]|nr:monovalent cation/H+ antiporter subunit D family protein [Methanosarcinales archaeon]